VFTKIPQYDRSQVTPVAVGIFGIPNSFLTLFSDTVAAILPIILPVSSGYICHQNALSLAKKKTLYVLKMK
jgi:hypothetical protein